MENREHAKKNKHLFLIVSVVLASIAACALVIVPVFKVAMMMTGPYKVDTVRFTLVDPSTATSGADGSLAPGVWIDTHISHSFASKTIESSKPYSIAIDHTDTTFKTKSIAFTNVKITYADGSVEKNQPSLPLVINSRDTTSTNSVSGGRVVTTKLRVTSGSIPNVITRDQAFTLELEGHINRTDGSKVPFKINQQYDVEIDRSTKPVQDVMQDT